ncbi:MAG: Ppx/GppA family phosphatase, partial [Myxococcota bacterium]
TGSGPSVDAMVSLEIGAIRLTDRYLPSDPPSPAELEALHLGIKEQLAHAPSASSDAALIGVSGTVTSLMGVHLGLDDMKEAAHQGEGRWLPKMAVERALHFFAARKASARCRGTIIPPGRADVIVAGTALVLAIMRHYGTDQLRATRKGVRYGLLAELFERDEL